MSALEYGSFRREGDSWTGRKLFALSRRSTESWRLVNIFRLLSKGRANSGGGFNDRGPMRGRDAWHRATPLS